MERNLTVTPELLAAFGLPQDVQATQVTTGHINDTFLLQAPERRLVLQRINHFVFPSPRDIMENIQGVTEFLREKIKKQGGDPERETLTVVPTAQGESFYLDKEGNYWRCTVHIENASSHETVGDPAMLEEAGRAFGRFQRLLCDYPAGTLHEIIPDFHNTPVRYAQLQEAAQKDAAGRLAEVQGELAFAAQRKEDCSLLMDLLNPERIVIGSVYARSEHLLREAALEVVQREALPGNRAACQVVPAALGDSLGDAAALSVALAALGQGEGFTFAPAAL